MTVLEARDLAVTPPGASAPSVSGFSLAVDRGEWIALTGPNGGGKSSLLLGLAGLWPCTGDLRLMGASFGPSADPALRRGLAVVLQDPSSQTLQPTVAEEIAFAPRNFGLAEEEITRRVAHWSRVFGLRGDLERDPARLSAGRQQLVLLAAALAAEPQVLIADEPSAHLDPGARELVREQIRRRVANGMAVVWATQLEEEIALARRSVTIGVGAAAQLPPPRPVPPAGTLLRIRIRPRCATEGPVVATDRHMDLEIADRGVTGLVGPNASGKSVILWAAAGLGTPDQLQLTWLGPRMPPPIAALQFPELQIFEEDPRAEVTFSSVERGAVLSDAIALAGHHMAALGLDLESMTRRRTWALAGGEKRLLEVVAALISPACLCLLDEPTAGLDPCRRSALADLVGLVAERTPVLVATQDQAWLAAVGARVHDLGAGPERGLTTPG